MNSKRDRISTRRVSPSVSRGNGHVPHMSDSSRVLEDSWDEGSFQVLPHRGNVDPMKCPVDTNSQYSHLTPLTMPCKPSTSTSNEDSQSCKPIQSVWSVNCGCSSDTSKNSAILFSRTGKPTCSPVLSRLLTPISIRSYQAASWSESLRLPNEKISTMHTASRRRESACRLFANLVCRRSIIRLCSDIQRWVIAVVMI